MTIAPMSFALLLVPFCISLVVLAAILLLREYQHQQIQKGLLDRLLVSQGHNPLPDIEPIAELTGESQKEVLAEQINEAVEKIKRMKNKSNPVSFNIPGMPRAGMGEVKRG